MHNIYNNIISNYSDIKKIKTNKFDSILLNDLKKADECLNKIYEWTGSKNIEEEKETEVRSSFS